jgi:hypothetical protein
MGSQWQNRAAISSGLTLINGTISTDGIDLNLLPDTGKITKIGTGTPGRLSSPTNDDLYVAGRVEIDQIVNMDSGFQSNANSKVSDNKYMGIGNGFDALLQYSVSGQTVESALFGVGAGSNALIVCEAADIFTPIDWGLAQQSNPTLVMQSANGATPAKRSLWRHNGADAELLAETGGVIITAPNSAPTPSGDSQIVFYLDESSHNLMVSAQYSNSTTKLNKTVCSIA